MTTIVRNLVAACGRPAGLMLLGEPRGHVFTPAQPLRKAGVSPLSRARMNTVPGDALRRARAASGRGATPPSSRARPGLPVRSTKSRAVGSQRRRAIDAAHAYPRNRTALARRRSSASLSARDAAARRRLADVLKQGYMDRWRQRGGRVREPPLARLQCRRWFALGLLDHGRPLVDGRPLWRCCRTARAAATAARKPRPISVGWNQHCASNVIGLSQLRRAAADSPSTSGGRWTDAPPPTAPLAISATRRAARSTQAVRARSTMSTTPASREILIRRRELGESQPFSPLRLSMVARNWKFRFVVRLNFVERAEGSVSLRDGRRGALDRGSESQWGVSSYRC